MTPEDARPTAAERADAADRFIDALDEAGAAMSKAVAVLRERQARGASGYSGPLFTFIGNDLYGLLDKARDFLWAAHKVAAVQGYDERRKADKDADHA